MKKLFLSIIALCLCACICVNTCYASTTESSGTGGYNTWSLVDKSRYWALYLQTNLEYLLGFDAKDNLDIFIDSMKMLYPQYDTDGCSNLYDYLAKNTEVSKDGNNWLLSNQMISLCNATYNAVKEDSYDTATFTYRYSVPLNNLDPDSFPNRTVYDRYCALIEANPELCFCYVRNNGYIYICFNEIDDVVEPNFDLLTATCTPYKSDWTRENKCGWIQAQGNGSGNWIVGWSSLTIDWNNVPDLKPYAKAFYMSDSDATASLYSFKLNNFSDGSGSFTDAYKMVTYQPTAFKCWKSLSDLKSGTANQYPLSGVKPTPDEKKPIPDDQKPTTPPSKDPNNGGGGGSDDDDSDSGWGLPTLIKGIKDLFSAIAEVIGTIVTGIADIIKQIIDSLKDLLGLINNDVTNFITQIFGFLPESFVKAILGVITLGLLFALFKLIRG